MPVSARKNYPTISVLLITCITISRKKKIAAELFFYSKSFSIFQQFTDIRLTFEIIPDCLNIKLFFDLTSVFNQIAKAAFFIMQTNDRSLRRLRFRNAEIVKALHDIMSLYLLIISN